METKFQTSFIPKKPITPVVGQHTPQHRQHTSVFMAFAVILFLASLGGIGGAYAWKQLLLTNQQNYKKELAQREEQFDIDNIEYLNQVNIKIDTAKQLLNKHLATSQIFEVISRMTSENIRFLDLDLTTPQIAGEEIEITMKGYGTSWTAVAWQSDVLGQLERYGLRKVIKNPILANPALQTGGFVNFSFSAVVDPQALSYKTAVTGVPIDTGTGNPQ